MSEYNQPPAPPFIDMMADLLDMATATEWMKDALCAQADPEAWFADADECGPAKTICAGCPARKRCADYAISEGIEWGVWGGLVLNPDERILNRDNDLAA